ncbi:MAG: ATP-binding cassette domain-containing protein [bacterium]
MHADAATPQVRANGLKKSYGGQQAVKGVDLDIHAGEVLAVVGDNGAGKSTFIKMLSGAVIPDAGEILIQGRRADIRSPADARALGIETLYQELGLVDVFNVPENIFLGREIIRNRFGFLPSLDHAEMRQQTAKLMDRLEIRLPTLDKPVRSYSGGQRQAIALSRLLLREVKLIIMDEPMAALGIDEANKVLRLIASLRDKGEAILVISHNLDHVFSIADRVAVMKNGALVGVVRSAEVSHDELISVIISGRMPQRETA